MVAVRQDWGEGQDEGFPTFDCRFVSNLAAARSAAALPRLWITVESLRGQERERKSVNH
jgi:hypothetical protein